MDALETIVGETEERWLSWQQQAQEVGLELHLEPAFVVDLKKVWEASDFVAQSCQREPSLLVDLVAGGDLQRRYAEGELDGKMAKALADVDSEAGLHRELRRFRRREMVRIIWRDLASWSPLKETLEDLSALADAAVRQTLEFLYRWATRKQGVPRNADGVQQHLLVIAMGKLGARELNLSSDIDLIFTYPAQGGVDGPRYLSNEQFFTRLSQQLIKALNTQTADGFVFRVDTRLRPFGESGPLAMCFDAMESYYESQARQWERYAMIKSRVLTGEPEAVARLVAMLQPFVYRRYLDFNAIESIRDMKRLIGRELLKKGISDNIKLGPGGIREIEFIGQAFQLIRGGRQPELQIRPILEVLSNLSELKLLPEDAVQELVDAYRFLRLVENRLQAWQDRQTHLLPESATAQLRLARAMGFADWPGFLDQLDQHRGRVQGHFDMVFASGQAEEERVDQRLLAIWEQKIDGEQAVEMLEQAGFDDGEAVLSLLNGFRGSHSFRLLSIRGRDRMDQLVPLLLAATGNAPNSRNTLERLLRLLEAIARRTAYLALLLESPVVLSQLVRLASVSPWIARQITLFPLLLDELLDPRRLYSPLQRSSLVQECQTVLSAADAEDQEQVLDRMRQFANSNKLRVAAADITGMIPIMVVSDYLTDIAEVVIGRALEHSWADLVARYGSPQGVLGEDKGFAVVGYGKLGGIELGYGSDLDLVFLHGSNDTSGMTANGERQVSNDVFYVRVGQRLIHYMTTRTASGLLYEIDMRLRPNGNSGMLVSSLEAFERYQKDDAWTWEHQALLRARVVAGDAKVGDCFIRIRREVLGRERDPSALRREVREMREKMRRSLDKSGSGVFDIKQGSGGIADIEFMVQYLVLRWAYRYPDLLDWTDNVRFLATLGKNRLLSEEVTAGLSDAYRALRAVHHRNVLRESPGVVPDDELIEERKFVTTQWETIIERGEDAHPDA